MHEQPRNNNYSERRILRNCIYKLAQRRVNFDIRREHLHNEITIFSSSQSFSFCRRLVSSCRQPLSAWPWRGFRILAKRLLRSLRCTLRTCSSATLQAPLRPLWKPLCSLNPSCSRLLLSTRPALPSQLSSAASTLRLLASWPSSRRTL